METIAGTTHCFNITGMCRILLYLLPDPVDMNSNRRTVADGIHAPDAFKQPFFESTEAARAAWAEQMGPQLMG